MCSKRYVLASIPGLLIQAPCLDGKDVNCSLARREREEEIEQDCDSREKVQQINLLTPPYQPVGVSIQDCVYKDLHQ